MLSKLQYYIRQPKITYIIERKLKLADYLHLFYRKPLVQSMIWVVAIFCLGFFMYYGSMQMKQDMDKKNNQDMALITSHYIDAFLSRIRATLQPIATLDTVRMMDDEGSITQILQSVYLNSDTITNLYVFDSNGQIKGAIRSQKSPQAQMNLTSRPVLSGTMATSGRSRSLFTNDSVFTVQVPIKSGSAIIGAVAADVSLDKLREQISQVELYMPYHAEGNMELLLFDGQGQLLHHNKYTIAQIEQGSTFNGTQLYQFFRSHDGSGSLTTISPWDNKQKIYSFAKIPNTEWGLGLAYSSPRISNFVYQYLWRDTLILLLFLLFTAMLYHSLRKTISREEILRRQTAMDPKTLLYNLKYFTEKAQEKIKIASEQGWPLGFILIDIDFFKHYNDTQGHLKGDYVLQEFSAILRKSIRDRDVIARYGGEEFIILLEKTGVEGTYAIADRIRQNVESWNFDGGDQQPNGRLTASFGVSCYPLHGTNVLDLIEKADIALYCSKSKGRNQVEIYNG